MGDGQERLNLYWQRYCILSCSGLLTSCLLTQSIYELCIPRIRSGDIQQWMSRMLGRPNVTFESDIVQPWCVFAHRFVLSYKIRLGVQRCGVLGRTKKSETEWTLENAAIRRGYSVTPVSPSSREMLSWGLVLSASTKSMIVLWLAYTRRWRGAKSPLPSTHIWVIFRAYIERKYRFWVEQNVGERFLWMEYGWSSVYSVGLEKKCIECWEYLIIYTWVCIFFCALAFIPRLDEVFSLLWYGKIQSVDAFSTTNERLTRKCDDGTHLFLSMTLYRIVASEPASDAARELSASFIR